MSLDLLLLFVLFLIVVLPSIYERYPAFRYGLKFCFLYVYVTVISILVIPVFACRPRDCRNIKICYYLIALPISSLLGIRWELQGVEHLRQDRGCIIVANHQSSLDVLGMFNMWLDMDKCVTIAKKVILFSPFGVAAWLGGQVFISRSSKSHATVNQVAHMAKNNKLKVFVFPEGTRSVNNVLLPFKKGAFFMAIDSQIPILPVVFSAYSFVDWNNKIFNPGKMIIKVLPAVSTEGLTKEHIEEFTEKVRNVMQQTYNEISAEAARYT